MQSSTTAHCNTSVTILLSTSPRMKGRLHCDATAEPIDTPSNAMLSGATTNDSSLAPASLAGELSPVVTPVPVSHEIVATDAAQVHAAESALRRISGAVGLPVPLFQPPLECDHPKRARASTDDIKSERLRKRASHSAVLSQGTGSVGQEQSANALDVDESPGLKQSLPMTPVLDHQVSVRRISVHCIHPPLFLTPAPLSDADSS
jgi:hypothetical protein